VIHGLCAYCSVRPAGNLDHVVSKSMQRKYVQTTGNLVPAHIAGTVASCWQCNTLKGARRLVPQSWEKKLPSLERHFPGVPWRVWNGDVSEPAYAGVWR